MSKFIRIGDKVINTDMVTDMEIGTGKISVFLAAPGTNGDAQQARVLYFEGEQAGLLQAWIDRATKEAVAEILGDARPQQITNSAPGAFG